MSLGSRLPDPADLTVARLRAAALSRLVPEPQTALYGFVVLYVEAMAVLFYPGGATLTAEGWLNVAYALLWINVSLWVLWRRYRDGPPVEADTRRRASAGLLVAGYLLVLFVAGGILRFGPTTAQGIEVAWLVPGWGPALDIDTASVSLTLFPYKTVGYLALGVLVYDRVLEASSTMLSGVLGLLSCVSCTWPVLAALFAGVFGSASGVASAVYTQSYGLSTVVFLVTVALLRWRPSW